jgi:hypothetical protein
MDKIKTILTLIAVIMIAFAVLAGIGLIYSLFIYIVILAVVCLGGLIAFRMISRPEAKRIQAPDPKREFEKVQRLLDQYKKDR